MRAKHRQVKLQRERKDREYLQQKTEELHLFSCPEANGKERGREKEGVGQGRRAVRERKESDEEQVSDRFGKDEMCQQRGEVSSFEGGIDRAQCCSTPGPMELSNPDLAVLPQGKSAGATS